MTPQQAAARQNLRAAIRDCWAAEAFGHDEAMMWFVLDCIARASEELPKQQQPASEPPQSSDTLWG